MLSNTDAFFNLFLIVSAIHGFIFSGILFFSKYGKNKSILFLNLLILSISLNNLQSWVLENHLFQHKFLLDYIQIPWHFLTAPFFYAFLVNFLNIEHKTPKILKVVIPIFVFLSLLQVSFVYFYSDTSNEEALDFLYEKYTSIEEIISFLSSIAVFIYSFYILYKKEKLFPKILSFDNLQWIYTFFKFGAITYILWTFALVIKINLNFEGFIFSYYPLRIVTTILVYWIGYQGFIQLKLLKDRNAIRVSLKKDISETSKKKAENLKNEVVEERYTEHFKIFDTYINSHKKYLTAKYTLENLSDDVGYSTSTLSAAINSCAGKSFIDYMNEKRVNQAKKILLNKDYDEYTITAIGLESGFNSKSSFYAVFKKNTGYTPIQFKNNK